MADGAGDLTFTFGADFSGFTRAAEGAGRKLDELGRAAAQWADDAAADAEDRLNGPLRLTDTMNRAALALQTPPKQTAATAEARPDELPPRLDAVNPGARAPQIPPEPATPSTEARPGEPLALTGATSRLVQAPLSLPKPAAPSDDDDAARKELAHLADQLALLRTTGAAHAAIAERIKVETEQAKLGKEATDAQKNAVAGLVGQIDAAKAAQTALRAEQAATNQAWRFGANAIEQGLADIIVEGSSLQNVFRSLLMSVARQGLAAALTGSGSLAGLFGTAGANGAVGGLFGSLGRLVGGGTQATAADLTNFSGLYAAGGTIGAGRWGIAGEAGPEVVAGPATVVPWNKVVSAAGSGAAARPSQTITLNVTTPDAPSFARSEGQIAALLARAVGRGGRNQ